MPLMGWIQSSIGAGKHNQRIVGQPCDGGLTYSRCYGLKMEEFDFSLALDRQAIVDSHSTN
jgi:hypothetical protein